ncbi:JAB domain-containing protein [Pediococcus pentosaceus]
MQTAILVNAPRVIIAHNHPLGHSDKPSKSE